MTRAAALFLLAFAACPAAAQDDARAYLGLAPDPAARIMELGTWVARDGLTFLADAFILPGGGAMQPLPVPETQADLAVRLRASDGSVALFAAIFSANPIRCGEEVGAFPIESGYAALMSPQDLAALDLYIARGLMTGGDDVSQQIDRALNGAPLLLTLPDATTYPIVPTTIEGDLPAYALYDTDGDMAALYGVFDLAVPDAGAPPPCVQSLS